MESKPFLPLGFWLKGRDVVQILIVSFDAAVLMIGYKKFQPQFGTYISGTVKLLPIPSEPTDLGQKIPRQVKFLNAIIAGISHIQVAHRTDRNGVWVPELPRPRAGKPEAELKH